MPFSRPARVVALTGALIGGYAYDKYACYSVGERSFRAIGTGLYLTYGSIKLCGILTTRIWFMPELRENLWIRAKRMEKKKAVLILCTFMLFNSSNITLR